MTRRITIPEGHRAIILTEDVADDLSAVLIEFRRQRRRFREPDAMLAVAGDVLLALLEAKESQA